MYILLFRGLALLTAALLAASKPLPPPQDAFYGVTHSDENQDALILGQVVGMDDKLFDFTVQRTLNGKLAANFVKLDATYGDTKSLILSQGIRVGDAVLVSVKYDPPQTNASGHMAYLLQKAEFATPPVEIPPVQHAMAPTKIIIPNLTPELAYLQWYADTGDDTAYLENEKLYKTDAAGNILLLYDGGWVEDPLDAKYRPPLVSGVSTVPTPQVGAATWVLIPLLCLLFAGAGAWLIFIRGRFPRARRALISLAPEADSKKT